MLNEKQVEAVNLIKGPVVIIAGPGTGKTKTLVERVVNILTKENTPPSKIILTTFTNKAAKELELRINEKLEEINRNIDISDMYIGTMHSIWLRLIEENIEYSNFFDGFQLMTSDYEQHFFIYSKLKEYRKLENFKEFFDNIYLLGDWEISSYIRRKINELNENSINIKEIRGNDKYINFIKSAYELYEKQLFEANKIDFSYLQVEFLNMLERSEEFLNKINEKIDYLMIDEYQDSNKIQEKILLLISKNKKNICVVGDEDQSIYRFRGATSENIINFSSKFIDCKTIILNKNYRSVNDIVEFNNKWINVLDWKGQRFKKDIKSMRTEGILNSSVFRIEGNTVDENLRNTVNFIKKLKEDNKITNYNQVAILFSDFKGNSAKKLENLLQKEGIEVFSPRTKIFFEAREIKLSLGLILACFKKYITKSNKYLEECLTLARYECQNDKKLLAFLKNKIDNSENIDIECLNEILYKFFQFEIFKDIISEKNGKNSKAIKNLSILSKIFKNFQKYVNYKKINFSSSFEVVKYFFEKYISILMRARVEEIYNEEDYPSDCIPFLTIHASKGLEFPVVIVFSLYSKPNIDRVNSNLTSIDRLLNQNNGISDIDKEYFDFYRKFYVAFTRAKNLLVLSSSTRDLSDNFKSFFYSIPSINQTYPKMDNIELDILNKKEEKKILSFTTDILTYEICPQKYNFLLEQKFQTFEKSKFNFGIVTHKVIEHINNRLMHNKNIKFPKEKIKELVQKIYNFRKMEFDDNIDKIVEIAFKYLDNKNFDLENISKIEASEYRIEKDYVLYGKVDLLLENEEEIQLIDFKTGKYIPDSIYSENYRRQLSLYKLLLEKKYKKKKIETYLYYLEENEAKKEIVIEDEELKKDYEIIEKISKNIIEKKFFKIDYDEKICLNCEFKYYCYGDMEI